MSARKRRSKRAANARRRQRNRERQAELALPFHLQRFEPPTDEQIRAAFLGGPARVSTRVRRAAMDSMRGTLRRSTGEIVAEARALQERLSRPAPQISIERAGTKSRRQRDREAEQASRGVRALEEEGFYTAFQILCGSLNPLRGERLTSSEREAVLIASDFLDDLSVTLEGEDLDDVAEQAAWLRDVGGGPIAPFLDAPALNEARRDALRRKWGPREPEPRESAIRWGETIEDESRWRPPPGVIVQRAADGGFRIDWPHGGTTYVREARSVQEAFRVAIGNAERSTPIDDELLIQGEAITSGDL